VVSVTKVVDAA